MKYDIVVDFNPVDTLKVNQLQPDLVYTIYAVLVNNTFVGHWCHTEKQEVAPERAREDSDPVQPVDRDTHKKVWERSSNKIKKRVLSFLEWNYNPNSNEWRWASHGGIAAALQLHASDVYKCLRDMDAEYRYPIQGRMIGGRKEWRYHPRHTVKTPSPDFDE